MEKQKEMQEIYKNLSQENKTILELVAKGIEIGQQNSDKGEN